MDWIGLDCCFDTDCLYYCGIAQSADPPSRGGFKCEPGLSVRSACRARQRHPRRLCRRPRWPSSARPRPGRRCRWPTRPSTGPGRARASTRAARRRCAAQCQTLDPDWWHARPSTGLPVFTSKQADSRGCCRRPPPRRPPMPAGGASTWAATSAARTRRRRRRCARTLCPTPAPAAAPTRSCSAPRQPGTWAVRYRVCGNS